MVKFSFDTLDTSAHTSQRSTDTAEVQSMMRQNLRAWQTKSQALRPRPLSSSLSLGLELEQALEPLMIGQTLHRLSSLAVKTSDPCCPARAMFPLTSRPRPTSSTINSAPGFPSLALRPSSQIPLASRRGAPSSNLASAAPESAYRPVMEKKRWALLARANYGHLHACMRDAGCKALAACPESRPLMQVAKVSSLDSNFKVGPRELYLLLLEEHNKSPPLPPVEKVGPPSAPTQAPRYPFSSTQHTDSQPST